MSGLFYIADLHIGHKKIINFEPNLRPFASVDEHDEEVVRRWNKVVGHRDSVWVLGDVCFDKTRLRLLHELNGRKHLVMGNHDTILSVTEWKRYFEEVYGLHKRKGRWLSHAPIHPQELRGCLNIHGHVHSNSIRDSTGAWDRRYVNVSWEACNGYPVSHQDICNGWYWQEKRT